MKKLSYTEILQQRLTVEEIKQTERHPISVMLTNVRSLYNVGSIFRSCDAARVEELILCGFTPHPPRKEIEKTALGAVDTVPWCYFAQAIDAITYLKEKQRKVFAVEIAQDSRSYDELQQTDFPCCLVLGNELTGIDDEIIRLCDGCIEIPMYGVKHSLNVAVAAGIMMFEAVRTFRKL